MQKIIDFLVELVQRFFLPTPKFFSTLRTISLIVGVVASLPTMLELFNVQLDIGVSSAVQKIVAIAAFVGALVSQLTKKDPNTPPAV